MRCALDGGCSSHFPKIFSMSESQPNLVSAVRCALEWLLERQSCPSTEVVCGVWTLPAPNDSFPSYDYFRASQQPDISIEKYNERLLTYMRCSKECYVFAFAYLLRAAANGVPVNGRSIHRLWLTALVVAAKARDDFYFNMSYYGQVGGVSKRDMAAMEVRFLVSMINFDTNLTTAEYKEICRLFCSLSCPLNAIRKQLDCSDSVSSSMPLSSSDSSESSPTGSRSELVGDGVAVNTVVKLFTEEGLYIELSWFS